MTRNVRAVSVASMCVGVHTAHVEHLSNPAISESIPLTEAKGSATVRAIQVQYAPCVLCQEPADCTDGPMSNSRAVLSNLVRGAGGEYEHD